MGKSVTLLWDQRPRSFDLDKLETAWLVYEEEIVHTTDALVGSPIRQRLVDDFKFSNADAIQYTVAIIRKLWSP